MIRRLAFLTGAVRGPAQSLYVQCWTVTSGEWRRLHNEELNDLYSSPNIVRAIKSRRMRWAGHVAYG